MLPVMFRVGSVEIRSFDVLVVLGMAVGLVLIAWRARRAGLNGLKVLAGGIGVVLAGLAGARLGFVLMDLPHFIANPGKIFSLYGTGFQGGLIVGILATALLARALRLSFWQLVDLFAPGLVLGQAIGRLGCLLNGCCYGVETDSFLGMYLPGRGGEWAYRYPTQLMHSAINLLILAVLLGVERTKPFDGFVCLLYLVLYSTQRLLLDFLREEGPTFGDSGVRGAVVAGALTILPAALLLAWKWVRARRSRAVPAREPSCSD